MNPWWTPWVAVAAAVVSAINLAWNVVQFIIDRREGLRVELDAAAGAYEVRAVVRVTNTSPKRDMQVNRIEFGFRGESQLHSPTADFAPALPQLLSPNQGIDLQVGLNSCTPTGRPISNCERLVAWDSKGRKHWARRRDVQKGVRAIAKTLERFVAKPPIMILGGGSRDS